MSNDSFTPQGTRFDFTWPKGISGIERVACCSNGDLQRMLSAYFNLPISVQRVWVETTPDPYPFVPSEATPVTQTRRVHLIVTPLPVNGASTAPAPKVACIATSTVTITSPEAAKFFLDEKYPIGQTFRVLGRVAEFKLLEVSTSRAAQESGEVTRESLRRRYTLRTDGFECDIEEVFPDRSMFVAETVYEWLAA